LRDILRTRTSSRTTAVNLDNFSRVSFYKKYHFDALIELLKMEFTPVFAELAALQRHQTKLLGKQQRFLSAKVTYKLDKI
jgi:hypothetical protein